MLLGQGTPSGYNMPMTHETTGSVTTYYGIQEGRQAFPTGSGDTASDDGGDGTLASDAGGDGTLASGDAPTSANDLSPFG